MSRTSTVPQALRAFFDAHPRLALAFSGGTDSAYLLYAAMACGCEVRAYYAQSLFQPAFEVKAVDTTAAGDTFTGFFLAGISSSISIPDALRRAAFASSIAVSRKGAADSIPTLEEVRGLE